MPSRRRDAVPEPARARAYAGVSLEHRRADRRERLFAAGLAAFGGEGYARTTIPALCASASVATRHFYEEYPTREALLRAVYDRVIASTEARVAAALAASGESPRERIFASLDAFLGSYLEDPRRGRVACIEVVGVSPALELHRRSVIHRFARVIEHESDENARRGHLPRRDFRLASIALAGATNELVIECFAPEAAPTLAEVRDQLVALYVAAFEGARAP
jgi:AcrR family transcriptional regulator